MLSVDQFWKNYQKYSEDNVETINSLKIQINDFNTITTKTFVYSDTNQYLSHIDNIQNINSTDYMNSTAYFIFECYDNQRKKLLCLSNKPQISFTYNNNSTYNSTEQSKEALKIYLDSQLKRLPQQNILNEYRRFTLTNKFDLQRSDNIYNANSLYYKFKNSKSNNVYELTIANDNSYMIPKKYSSSSSDFTSQTIDGYPLDFIIIKFNNNEEYIYSTNSNQYNLYYQKTSNSIITPIQIYMYNDFLTKLNDYIATTNQSMYYTLYTVSTINAYGDRISYKVINLNYSEPEYDIYYIRTIIGDLPIQQTNFDLLTNTLSQIVRPDTIELTKEYEDSIINTIPVKSFTQLKKNKNNNHKYNQNLLYYIFFIFIILIIILIILYRLYIC